MGYMNRRQKIRKHLKGIMSHDPTGDPHQNQIKRLESLNVETLLEVVDTLDKMDETNKALDESNKNLAKSNLNLQKVAVGIAILGLITSIVLGLVALHANKTVKIELNGKETIRTTN